MAWDEHAKKVAIKCIGTVESSMNYQAINYNDPITVGIAQWFGTRAASILNRMRTAHPAEYAQVTAGFRSKLEGTAASSSSWNTYYLSRADGESLKPLLAASADVQGQQLVEDLEGYVSVANQYGLNHQTNTNTFIYFCCAYHQGPRYALQVLRNIGGSASLAQIHQATLANGVLGRYRNRYNQAYQIISSGDTSGVGTPGGGGATTPGNGVSPGVQYNTETVKIEGTEIIITQDNSGTLQLQTRWGPLRAHLAGHNMWRAKTADIEAAIGRAIQEAADGGGGGGGVAPPSDGSAGSKALAWMLARQGKFAYLQAPGRLNPDSSGFGDCSSTCYRAYMDTSGINVGTWTGDQYNRGYEVMRGGGMMTAAQLQQCKPGDLIVMAWRSTGSVYPETDHVEMFMDTGHSIGHGGPMRGPIVKDIGWLARTRWWTVRRHG